MSQRTHFWLRIIGLVAIFATEFGPRMWTAASPGTGAQGARVAAAADVGGRP